MQNYGFLSIVPPLLTIALAIYSKNVIFALTVGILCGSLVITDFHPFAALLNAIEDQLMAEVANGTQAQVILTTTIIGGFVKLLEVSGGARAFSSRLSAGAPTSCRSSKNPMPTLV